jgi:hypothetical protein
VNAYAGGEVAAGRRSSCCCRDGAPIQRRRPGQEVPDDYGSEFPQGNTKPLWHPVFAGPMDRCDRWMELASVVTVRN